MREAPPAPINGIICESFVSNKTVPGISQGKPPKKKSLVSSIIIKADVIKSRECKDRSCFCSLLNSANGATANSNIKNKKIK
jgi:hypothetical protein